MSEPTPPADVVRPRVRVRLPNVLAAIGRQPWAIVPDKLQAILDVVALHAAGSAAPTGVTDPFVERRASILDLNAAARSASTAKGGGVAVIPVYGTLTQRASLFAEYSGGTSTEQLGAQFDAAMASPQVGTIVLDLDSPGGSTQGIPELGAKIAAARGEKRIVAVANTMAASAAYWLAAQADEIVASPSAWVGSIGVFMVHTDVSAAEAQAGVRHTIVSAGKYKAEANAYEPLSDDARAALQAQVDEFYTLFADAVASGRGISAAKVRSGYGEGRVLTAQQALAAGMVDRIATLDEVLAGLTGRRTASAARPTRAAVAAEPARAASALAASALTVTVDARAIADQVLADLGVHVPLAGADEAAPALPSPSLASAPAARSVSVSDTNTAAPGAAPDAVALERTRARDVRALAREHGITDARADALVDSGATVEQAAVQILTLRRAEGAAAPATRSGPAISVGADRAADRPFASIGEQLVSIVQAGKPGGRLDPRLNRINAAASGMNEGVGSEGGFFIQPDLLPGVIDPVYTDDPILSRVTRIPIGAARTA
jgi:signal peptide peptidase SppA